MASTSCRFWHQPGRILIKVIAGPQEANNETRWSHFNPMGENMLGCKTVIALAVLAVLIVFPLFPALTQAQNGAPASPQFADSVPLGDTIPVGTRITVENWQKYEQFMPDGMIALFQRRDYWKMPDDLDMEVGPTVIHPLPKTYLDATEKYGSPG